MKQNKRDTSYTRTPQDIERKYNLGKVSEIGRSFDSSSETIARLLTSMQNLEKKVNSIEISIIEPIRYTYYYIAPSDTSKIELPDCYKEGFCVDVFICGVKLEKTAFDIILEEQKYYVALNNILEKGNLLEINIINVKEEIVS